MNTNTLRTMETICLRCDGTGELECCECNQFRGCPDCGGDGFVECGIADWDVPKNHKSRDELLKIQADAERCFADHAKLVEMNPRAKESYDAQLATTLEKLNAQAKDLL